ncbi:hypothetical protein Droror1_Dr00027142 [Drosera rotundifolia]
MAVKMRIPTLDRDSSKTLIDYLSWFVSHLEDERWDVEVEVEVEVVVVVVDMVGVVKLEVVSGNWSVVSGQWEVVWMAKWKKVAGGD